MNMKSPLACDMSALDAAQRSRHLLLTSELAGQAQEVREVSEGYAIRFPSDPKIVLHLAEFMSLESLCCPFLTLSLELEPRPGPAWLQLTGPEGAKALIRDEFSIPSVQLRA